MWSLILALSFQIAVLHSKMRHADTMKAAAKAAMKKLFAPEGARLVSWCGTGGLKFSFCDTNLCLAVEGKWRLIWLSCS